MRLPATTRASLAALALCAPTLAQTHVQRLTASDGAASDSFGAALALDGDVLAVGAPYVGPDKGAVYVFERAGGLWAEVAKLEPGSVPGGVRFGSALALEGDRLLVGAPSHPYFDGPSGFVIVYERVGGVWVELERLHASDAEPGDRFGTALALDGDALLVGASGHDRWGSDTGAAYAFERGASSWNEVQALRPRRVEPGMAFGGAVALEGRRCVVTAPGDREGSAHAFRRTAAGWRAEAELHPSDGRAGDSFGRAVVLTDRWVVVSAHDHGCFECAHGHLDDHAGALYAFGRSPSGWSDGVELFGSGIPSGYWCRALGHSLAVSDGRLFAGAPGWPICPSSNAAFVFRSDATGSWPVLETATLDSAVDEDFGASVALDGATAAVGAPGASPSGPASGAVDVFEP